MAPSCRASLRLLLALSLPLSGTHGHPLHHKPVQAGLPIDLEVFSAQNANFPGPYTLLPDPSIARRFAGPQGPPGPPGGSPPWVPESTPPGRTAEGGWPWGPPSGSVPTGEPSGGFPWTVNSPAAPSPTTAPSTAPASVVPSSPAASAPPSTSTASDTALPTGASSSIPTTTPSPSAPPPVPTTSTTVSAPPTTLPTSNSSVSAPPSTSPVSSAPSTTSLSTPPTTSSPASSPPATTSASTPPTTSASIAPTTSTPPTTLSTVVSSSPITTTSTTPVSTPTATPQSTPGYVQIDFTNNLGSPNVHVYITGLDSSGQVTMLNTDGQFYNPSTTSSTPVPVPADVAIPLPSSLIIPGYLSSARFWFADGTLDFTIVATPDGTGLVAPTSVNPDDPSHDTNWGFVEMTWIESGLFADISYVDFVGLPLGLQLTDTAGASQLVPGVPADGVTQVCDQLKAVAAADGQPWDQLCVAGPGGDVLRVLSPGSYLPAHASAFQDYFGPYVDQVWQAYTSAPLTINTQNSLGDVACQVGSDGLLSCAGDNGSYGKPTAADIFSCATGPFAIPSTANAVHLAVVPRLCAAFNRATFLLAGGNVQPGLPPSAYYTAAPNNEYSAVVHQVEENGEGYTFPYDDVAPSEADNVAGAVYAADPLVMTVIVG